MEYRYRDEQEMKDSGVEWLGCIPKLTSIIKLSYVAQFKQGEQVDIELQKYNKENGYTRFIRIVDYTQQTNDYRFVKSNLNKTVNENDLVMVRYGATAGYIGRGIKGIIANNLFKIEANNKFSKEYLFYLLKQKIIFDFLNSNGGSSAMPAINFDLIKKIEIPSLEFQTQQKIANFLDKKTSQFDTIIEKKEKLINKLEEAKKSLISEVVTGKLKVEQTSLGDFHLTQRAESEMKDSGVEWLGEIPKEWEVKKLKHITELNKKKVSENENPDLKIEYIDIGSVKSTGQVVETQNLIFSKAPSRAKRILSDGDTIVSTVRTYLKAISFFNCIESNLICSTGFAVFSPKINKISPQFLYFLLSSEKYINKMVQNSVGVSYPAINAIDISQFECSVPSRKEQSNIITFLDKKTSEIDSTIAKIKTQVKKIKEAKQSLISEAVTGKIEVL